MEPFWLMALVSDGDPLCQKQAEKIREMCRKAEIKFFSFGFPKEAERKDYFTLLQEWNEDCRVGGILLLLSLSQEETAIIQKEIKPEKNKSFLIQGKEADFFDLKKK